MTDKPKYYDDKSKVRTMRYQQEHRDRETMKLYDMGPDTDQ